MTRTQFRKKVNELIRENNRLIKNRVEKLFKSGCVDLNDYDNDFRLPKMFMYAIGKEMQFQWKPLDDELLKTGENIARVL